MPEANFDGLVGPTHHYGGLAAGNLASARHGGQLSNPRAAALQGLAKMRALRDLGLAQGILPPQQRPDVALLRALGFGGHSDHDVVAAAAAHPGLLSVASSAAAMWTANAATVTPGADSGDGRVHVTPANLVANLHRSIEYPTTARALAATFPDPTCFSHHPALPATPALGDEGAANHTRLCAGHDTPGIGLFVYGKPGHRFAARQTRLASEAVARQHGLAAGRTVLAEQHPDAIDAGVFHNDVICVGNGPVLLYHALAFADEAATLRALSEAADFELQPLRVDQISLEDAVASYLFNSQLVTLPGGDMALICAQQCRDMPAVWATIQRLLDGNNPINHVHVFDLNQSMHNGGGPACLRLRVVLDDAQHAAVNAGSWASPSQLDALETWVREHYRDRLQLADLADPALLDEVRTGLEALTGLLGLGSIYPFQLGGT